ncbi:adhesin [Paenibacillus motobuensis]|uniref:Disulfide oxidoreductase n=1 Tax=Paenibacillus motobuensis TaxID=295324 RepID=A0ABN0YCB7_9BACL
MVVYRRFFVNRNSKAKVYIEEVMKEAGIFSLRFGFSGQGCCGPNYEMALEGPMDEDIIHLVNHIQVAVDPQIADLVIE